MDEEDMYGIPGDYFSNEAFQNYTECTPMASIDEFGDIADNPLGGFGEYMRATIVDFFFMLCYMQPLGRGTLLLTRLFKHRLNQREHCQWTPIYPIILNSRQLRGMIRNPHVCAQLLTNLFPLTYLYQSMILRAHTSGVVPYNVPTRILPHGFSLAMIRNTDFRITSYYLKETGTSEEEACTTRTEYGFTKFRNYVRGHSLFFSSPEASLSLADMYRTIFKFGVFNAMQSSCFDTVSFCYRFKWCTKYLLNIDYEIWREPGELVKFSFFILRHDISARW